MFERKSVAKGKSLELYQVLITWFNLRVSEGVEISGALLKEQANRFAFYSVFNCLSLLDCTK